MTNTQDQIKRILIERFGISAADIQPATQFQQDLNFDSMDSIDLLFVINDTFHIHMPQEALDDVYTVSDLVSTVDKYKTKKNAHSS